LAGLLMGSGMAPIARQPCLLDPGRARGNNVVGCFCRYQPGSRILLSTPLGRPATGPARRGKSPLIWSWKERGKVILRCLRRWVIRAQSWARARGAVPAPAGRWRCRAAPGGDAQPGKQPAGSGTRDGVGGPGRGEGWRGGVLLAACGGGGERGRERREGWGEVAEKRTIEEKENPKSCL
jgi:hypothetical protein